MIKVLIVDDEPLARDTLRLGLQSDPELEVAGACTGVEAIALIPKLEPQLVFLDVQMPQVSGFDVIEAVGPETLPAIVFVTAYDRYALRAFDVHALDYLLKPFDDARLRRAVDRAKEQLRSRSARGLDERLLGLLEDRESARPFTHRFAVRGREKTVFVTAASVGWIQAADDYVELHAGGQSHLLRERLSTLEQRLDPARFVRVHRSTIVNLEQVRELRPLFRGDSIIVLHDGTELRLSRSHRAEFERRLTRSPQPGDGSPQHR